MSYQETHSNHKEEFLVALAAAVVGSLGVWYVYSLGLVRQLTDAHAHLNFSKMLFESLTPGISQIGFWPPLLHILMGPFTQIPALYNSGLAGAAVLLPFYILGTLFCYKLIRLVTGINGLAILGAVLFMANPYILYYTAAPMMEVMFIGNLMAVAYFVAAWMYRGRFSDLVWTSVFVTLATLSRYEGLILVPVVAIVFIASMIKNREQWPKIQAASLLFGMVAVLGAAAIFIYSWMFGGSPLAFTGGSWVKSADVSDNIMAAGSVQGTFEYLLHASYHMLGQGMVWFALISLPFLAIVARKRLEVLGVLAVLISPVLFIAVAIYSGSYNIAVPDLAPNNIFLNERYGLSWIGFAIVTPLLLLGYVLGQNAISKWLKYSAVGAGALAIAALVYTNTEFVYGVVKQDQYFVIRNNINTPRQYQRDLAAYLNAEYDYGKVLITRTDNDPVLSLADLELDDYIYEANYLYFDQALNEPWIFARWVVMYNSEDGKDQWAMDNENIARRWGSNEQFLHFYDLVYENSSRQVYRVKPERVIEYAQASNLDLHKIPSINNEIAKWNPGEFYRSLEVTYGVKKN